jgi:hypothetical protein
VNERSSERFKARWPACLCAAVLVSLAAPSARAQSAADLAQARALYNEGMDLRDSGNASAALEKLKAANALARTPITALELGKTYELLGRLIEAREAYLAVARTAPQPGETERSRAARRDSARAADALRSRIGSLTIRITGSPLDTVQVTIDGVVLPAEAIGAPRPVDPGEHLVVAHSNDGDSAESRVQLGSGEARDVELRIAARPSVPTPAPGARSAAPVEATSPPGPAGAEAPTKVPSHSVAPWVLVAGGAVVGLGGGALMIVESIRSSSASENHDTHAYDATKTPWTVGLVGAIAGGAATALGVVLLGTRTHDGTHARIDGASLWAGAGAAGVHVTGGW